MDKIIARALAIINADTLTCNPKDGNPNWWDFAHFCARDELCHEGHSWETAGLACDAAISQLRAAGVSH